VSPWWSGRREPTWWQRQSPARGGKLRPPSWRDRKLSDAQLARRNAADEELLYRRLESGAYGTDKVDAETMRMLTPGFLRLSRRRHQAALDRMVVAGWLDAELVDGRRGRQVWVYSVRRGTPGPSRERRFW
jgi:hypothetical protein